MYGLDAAAKNAVMPVRLFVDGELVAEGRVRVADLDQSYLIVTHGETGTSLAVSTALEVARIVPASTNGAMPPHEKEETHDQDQNQLHPTAGSLGSR